MLGLLAALLPSPSIASVVPQMHSANCHGIAAVEPSISSRKPPYLLGKCTAMPFTEDVVIPKVSPNSQNLILACFGSLRLRRLQAPAIPNDGSHETVLLRVQVSSSPDLFRQGIFEIRRRRDRHYIGCYAPAQTPCGSETPIEDNGLRLKNMPLILVDAASDIHGNVGPRLGFQRGGYAHHSAGARRGVEQGRFGIIARLPRSIPSFKIEQESKDKANYPDQSDEVASRGPVVRSPLCAKIAVAILLIGAAWTIIALGLRRERLCLIALGALLLCAAIIGWNAS